MNRSIIIIALTMILLVVACENDEQIDIKDSNIENDETTIEELDENKKTEEDENEKTEQDENEKTEQDENEDITEDESIEENEEQSNTENINEDDGGTLSFIESINISPIIPINSEKVSFAIEEGFESPETKIDSYHYIPKKTDIIYFDSQKTSLELGKSLIHKGFEGLEIRYERTKYKWNDLFGDLDFVENKREITVSLKGDSIFEADIVDDNEKYYRYFDETEGLYYEVTDLMVGSYIDENAELTNARSGNSCNYNGIDGIESPTYNPLILQKGEEAVNYFVTVLDGKPSVYIETLFNGNLHKKWIDIEFGVLVKELIFDDEGLLVDKKVATSITNNDIEGDIFVAPKDVDYKDITLFVFSISGGDVETIFEAFDNTIPANETGILLSSDDGGKVKIYTRGIGDMSIEEPIYYSENTLDSGEKRTIREVKDNRFYTICDELEKVEIFDKSCYEKKFFNFEDVGLIGLETLEEGKSYTFYDPNNISVSALYDVYEYIIKNGEFTDINYYQIESLSNNEPIRDVITYKISFIDFDENVYDESWMDNYEIIDRGENSFNDGEYMPFWYE